MLVRRVQCLAAAAALAVAAYVHLRIWQGEYRHAPVREMFLAQVVASAVVAALLVITATRRRLTVGVGRVALLAGMLLAGASLIAFAVSRGPGLPTLHGMFRETGLETTRSYVFGLGSAKTILVAETATLILCGTVLIGRLSPRPRRAPRA